MGAHRDDRDAARARITALERELADAKDEAALARREADEARGAAARPAKREDGRADEAPAHADPRWRPGVRRRYVRGTTALGAAVYALAAAVLVAGAPIGAELLVPVLLGGATAIVAGTFVLGRVVRAPAPFEGSNVTLIASPIVLGVLCAACSDEWWPAWIDEGPARLAGRIAISLVVVVVGVLVTAAWATDAASAPDRSTD